MRILDIYEHDSHLNGNKNFNLVWKSRIKKKIKNSLSIYDLVEKYEKLLKLDLNNHLKDFFNLNKKYFFPFFNLKKDFSFLVLSNFIEKNPYKKNFNLNLIKSFALRHFLKSNKFDKINVHSNNNNFIESIDCIIKKTNTSENKFILIKNYFKFSILFIKNFIRLIFFVIGNINLKKINKNEINKYPFFFSFFSYKNKKKAMNGIYQSDYWQGFSRTDNKNWVHLFDPSSDYPDSRFTSAIIKKLNIDNKKPNHFFINDYLTINVFFKTAFFFTKLFFFTTKLFLSNKFLKIVKKNLNLSNKNSYLFFEEFISFNSIRNILFFYQFENFFSKHKIESNVFFSFENQPWEKIILYFLNKNKLTIKSHGVIHSSIRFWDFRFINLISNKKSILGYFNPNKILSNSFFAKKILFDNGFFKKQLLDVESLRYLNLKNTKKKKEFKKRKKLNILFLTDYDDHINTCFIQFIKSLGSNPNYSLFLKCHPLKPIKLYQKNLKIISSIENTKNIDFVIVGNKTSASLDFYYKNINLLIFLDEDELDYSPLYKFTNYSTFSNIDEMYQKLNMHYLQFKYNNNSRVSNNKSYFILDKNLPRWKKIINL